MVGKVLDKARRRQGEGEERGKKGGSTSTSWEALLTPTSRRHSEPKRDYTLLGAVGRSEDNSP